MLVLCSPKRKSLALRKMVFVLFVAFYCLANGVSAWAQNAEDPLAAHFNAARSFLRSSDQERAATEYKAFLNEALHRVANARARAGDLPAAAGTFEEALVLGGQDLEMRLDYASVLFDQERLDDAESVAQKVVALEPEQARARLLLGRIHFEKKDYSAAKQQLEKAASAGEFREVWHLLGIADLRLQRLEDARLLLRKVIGTLGDTPATHVAVAMTYYYGDYPDDAAAELKKAIAKDNAAADAHYFLGLCYLARNEAAGFAKAIPEFQAQLQITPDDFRSHYVLGYIALQRRDFKEAKRELSRAEALNPADEGTQLSLGQLFTETQHTAEAEDILRKLIAAREEKAPDFGIIRAHYMLGRMLQQSGRADEGTAEIRTSEQMRRQLRFSSMEVAENREHGFAGGGNANAMNHSGAAPVSAEDRERAQAFISQLSPLIGEAYYNLGGISARHHDAAKAAEYSQKAAEWDPTIPTGQRP